MNGSTSRAPLAAQHITHAQRARRAVWNLVWAVLGKTTPNLLHGWRSLLARAFGAQVGQGVHIYPHARIWAPWNLKMGDRSCLADHADCYNVAPIEIGVDAVISQDACLCTATHDYNDPAFPLMTAPIVIEPRAWVAAGAFLSPGVIVRRGAVVAARAVVTASVPEWSVAAGNPARVVKQRINFEAFGK